MTDRAVAGLARLPLLAAALLGVAALAGAGFPGAAAAQTDDPAARWAYFLEQRSSPGVGGLAARLQQARAQVLRHPLFRRTGLRSAVEGTSWQPLGPRRIVDRELPAAGRVSAVTLHPTDLNVVYVGGAQGGVWRSDDQGASWRPLTDGECSLAMGAVALDPVAPEIVYAGTGEQHFSGDSYYGCGVLRSTDGGRSWRQLGAQWFIHPDGWGTRIARMAVDPGSAGTTTSTVVYAATEWGLFRSGDSGGTWSAALDGVATDVLVHPDRPGTAFAAVRGEGVFRSADRGATWDRLEMGLDDGGEMIPARINLAQAHSNPEVLYASVAEKNSGRLIGIYRTDDGGDTWKKLTAGEAGCGSQCWYDMALAVHPENPEIVYFGGIQLYRSRNGGISFTEITGPPWTHVDQHVITTDPRRPDMVLVGNDGGVYRSMDMGGSWESLNTNLELAQFYGGVSIDPHGPWRLAGGTQDNGTLRVAVSEMDWRMAWGGDGGYTAIHPTRSELWLENQWGGDYSGPRRIIGNGRPVQRANGIDLTDEALFIPPLVMDPFDPSVLYFGTVRLYRTGNGGERWEVIGGPFPHKISAIAPALSDSAVVYVGTRGAVHATTDGGATWASGGALPSRWVTDLAVHPRDPARAWVTVSGFGTGHVFVTDDFGATWQDATGNLPDHPVNAILLDPGNPEQLFVGTDLSVFASTSAGRWERFDEGMPMVAVFDLAAEPNAGVLVAATHGRGAFSLPVRADVWAQMRAKEVALELAVAGDPVSGAAVVRTYGTGWPDAEWRAWHGGAPWLALDAESGLGFDSVRWTVDPQKAPGPGVHEETIAVTAGNTGAASASRAAGASSVASRSRAASASSLDEVAGPAQLRVRIEVFDVAAVELGERASGVASTIAGVVEWRHDTVLVNLRGPGADEAAWTATADAANGAGWLELLVFSGGRGDPLAWRRSARELTAGQMRVAEIRVGVDGSAAPPVLFADTLRVAGDVSVEAAARGLVGGGRSITLLQRAVLDRLGNADGTYNLGDFLSWRQRCRSGGAKCAATAPGDRP